jgi:hypothetical protein
MSHSGPFQFLVSKGRDAVKRWIVNIFGALYHRQQHGNQNVYGRRTGRCSCPRTHRSVRNGAPVSRLYRLYAEAALITATSEISSVTAPEARTAVRIGTLMLHAPVRRKQLRSIGNYPKVEQYRIELASNLWPWLKTTWVGCAPASGMSLWPGYTGH